MSENKSEKQTKSETSTKKEPIVKRKSSLKYGQQPFVSNIAKKKSRKN